METMEILQFIWFILIGVLFIGYSILDGFDLGIGSLLPFLSKNEKETGALFSAIGPVWDGNEVWLLTAGGALFAAFPDVYATVFSGFYLALMLVLFALIFRAVSIEFWSLEEEKKSIWKWTFVMGSFLPALLYGVALGNVIVGIPLDKNMEFTGSFFTLLRPFPLAIGLLGLAAILMQGATFVSVKLTGPVQERASALGRKIWFIYIALFVIATILSAIFIPGSMKNPLAWAAAAFVIVSLIFNFILMGKGKNLLSFVTSSLAFMGLWGIAAAVNFPNLVRASGGQELSLSIFKTSSTQLTLTVMLIIALIGMPVVIGYTIYVYRVFKDKVST